MEDSLSAQLVASLVLSMFSPLGNEERFTRNKLAEPMHSPGTEEALRMAAHRLNEEAADVRARAAFTRSGRPTWRAVGSVPPVWPDAGHLRELPERLDFRTTQAAHTLKRPQSPPRRPKSAPNKRRPNVGFGAAVTTKPREMPSATYKEGNLSPSVKEQLMKLTKTTKAAERRKEALTAAAAMARETVATKESNRERNRSHNVLNEGAGVTGPLNVGQYAHLRPEAPPTRAPRAWWLWAVDVVVNEVVAVRRQNAASGGKGAQLWDAVFDRLPAVASKTLGQPRRRKPCDYSATLVDEASTPAWFSKGPASTAIQIGSTKRQLPTGVQKKAEAGTAAVKAETQEVVAPSTVAAALDALASELRGHIDSSRFADVTEGDLVRGWADDDDDHNVTDSGGDDIGNSKNGVLCKTTETHGLVESGTTGATSAELVPELTLEELFLKLDLDGNGYLNKHEVVSGADKLNLSTEHAGALFDKLDVANNGKLSREQFESGASVRSQEGALSYSSYIALVQVPFISHWLDIDHSVSVQHIRFKFFLYLKRSFPTVLQLLRQLGKLCDADRPPFPNLMEWRLQDPAELVKRQQHDKACAAAKKRRDNIPPSPPPPFGSPQDVASTKSSKITGKDNYCGKFTDRVAHARCRAIYRRSCSWITLEEVAAVRAARACLNFCADGGSGNNLCSEDANLLLTKPNLTSNWSRKVLFCPGNKRKEYGGDVIILLVFIYSFE